MADDHLEEIGSQAAAMMNLTEAVLAPLRAAIIGHRAELLDAGIGEAFADEMAAGAHAYMVHLLTRPDDPDPEESEQLRDP